MIWVLFFVLLTPVAGLNKVKTVHVYEKEQDCRWDKEALLEDLKALYPVNTNTFTLECVCYLKEEKEPCHA